MTLASAARALTTHWTRELSQKAFVPRAGWAAPAPLPKGGYARADLWINHGADDGPARWRPSGVAPQPLRAAVFFVHPTSCWDREHWNGELGGALIERATTAFVRHLVSPFGEATELWVPRYRQATFGAFLGDHPEAERALDLAYSDVEAAFAVFLAGVPADLPIVLAGHSQGAVHLMRLMRDHVAGRPLAARVAAAYVVGWPISLAHDLPLMGLPACTAPDQPGCVLSWLSFGDPADPALLLDAYARRAGLDGQSRAGSPFLCVNPISGRQNDEAPASANLGSLLPAGARLAPGLVGTRCGADGLLHISAPPLMKALALPGNNYHIHDIPLFWANLRADVARRVAAWRAQGGTI